MPVWARLTSPSAACSSFRMMFSTSSPTYPASVSVVASTIAKGTSSMRASVCASSVLPVPVGPISMMFDFDKLDAIAGLLAIHEDALVVVVNRDRQLLLGLLLPDDVFVEEGFHFLRLGQLVGSGAGGVAVRSSSRMELQTATHSSQM